MVVQKFKGTIAARTFNIINSNENYKIHRLDMNKALNLNAKLETDDPNAFMTLAIFNKESVINNVNNDFFIRINVITNIRNQRLITFGTGGMLIIDIPKNLFDPNDYIFQVLNNQSSQDINYTLTISYEEGNYESFEINPFLGFWSQVDRNFQGITFEIKQRSDGSLYYRNYIGNNQNGYTKISILGFTLIKTRKGYRYYFGMFEDGSNYFYLNLANSNQLFNTPGGTTNPRNNLPRIVTFNRIKNPNIVDFLEDSKLSTPTFLFEEFFNTNFLTGNPQFARDLKANDYPGINKITKLKNEILSTGIVEKSVGTEIWPEQIFFGDQLNGNSIRTYAPFEIKNVTVIAQPFQNQNALVFEIPSGFLETGMLVQLSNSKGNPAFGIPTEWVNGLFHVQVLSTDEEKSFVGFISQIAGSAQRVVFIINSVYSEAQIKITPRCFKVTSDATTRIFSGTINSSNTQILQLKNFSSVGGLNASQINKRVTVFSRINNTQFFVTTSSDIIASRNEETLNSGIIEICTLPENTSLVSAVNFVARQTLPPNPITLFFTEEPNSVSSYSQVKISGLTGDYSKLNGIHDANPTNFERSNSNITKEIWKEGYYSPNRKHYFSLKVESYELPSFNPIIHTENGKSFSVERIVSQLTDDSGYGDFADACLYLYWKQGVNTHASALFYNDSIEGQRNPSWEQMQFQIANVLIEQNETRNRITNLVSSLPYISSGRFYSQIFGNLLNKNSYNNTPGDPIDPNLRINPLRLQAININFRYLDESQLFNVYARVFGPVLNERVPGSDPDNENISNFMTNLGYDGNGTFVKYNTSNIEYNSQLGIFFNRETPEPPKQFLLTNAYNFDGFTREEFNGELILADPPVGVSSQGVGLLKNAKECKGKIVVFVEISQFFGFNDDIIYEEAVEAGAIGIILVTEEQISQFSYGFPLIPMGPQNNVMIYASNLSIGNELIGYNGVGNRNDPASYLLSTNINSDYAGSFKIPVPLGRRVGFSNFQFSIIKPEFTKGKDIGYIYLPNISLIESTEFNPIFWEEYGKSTLIDQYAKLWAAILSTKFTTESGQVKTLSQMDSIIIDNSNNDGGFNEVVLALASFFGDDRPSLQFISSSVGTGFSASTSLKEIVGNLPSSNEIRLQFWNRTMDLECLKYREKYPEAVFSGKSVIILTSVNAFSAGDILPHYFRNTRSEDYGNLGNEVKSILVGNIDGRFAGLSSSFTPFNYPARTSIFSLAPSILGITAPLYSYRLRGENNITYYNSYTKEPITSQLPEIKIDNKDGPTAAWFEDDGGFFQAFGFSTVYERGQNSRYNRFASISERPIPYQSNTYHHPFLEDAILASTE